MYVEQRPGRFHAVSWPRARAVPRRPCCLVAPVCVVADTSCAPSPAFLATAHRLLPRWHAWSHGRPEPECAGGWRRQAQASGLLAVQALIGCGQVPLPPSHARSLFPSSRRLPTGVWGCCFRCPALLHLSTCCICRPVRPLPPPLTCISTHTSGAHKLLRCRLPLCAGLCPAPPWPRLRCPSARHRNMALC
jgi:hypothetical protein